MASNSNSHNKNKKRSCPQNDDNPKPKKRRRRQKGMNDYFEEQKTDKSIQRKKKQNEAFEMFKNEIINSRMQAIETKFDETRIRPKGNGVHGIPPSNMSIGGVCYWISRDQRVQDNWALIYAQNMAIKHKAPLFVTFCLQPSFLGATLRQFDFMLRGLEQAERELFELNIPFHLLLGSPKDVLPSFANSNHCNLIVTDFGALRISKKWIKEVGTVCNSMNIHLCQIDAHNVVPLWVTSNKQEYAARTIRSKIHRNLQRYLVPFPPVIRHECNKKMSKTLTDWNMAKNSLSVDENVGIIDWCEPGTDSGLQMLHHFICNKLCIFAKDRNNPTIDALSNMSPFYHFGQVSAARAAMEVSKHKKKFKESVDGYLEELIVRRELADNFCFFNNDYDKIEGAYQWAQDSLNAHAKDKREYVYKLNEFEEYQTHDDLWNAAQKQLVIEGKMHGFLRMYWAKKILEWTKSPKEALKFAIYLNDRYSIDGRDSNGYVGCMWSIAGIHDQGWKERPIFGKVRFMNYNGCKRKFDVAAFVAKMATIGKRK